MQQNVGQTKIGSSSLATDSVILYKCFGRVRVWAYFYYLVQGMCVIPYRLYYKVIGQLVDYALHSIYKVTGKIIGNIDFYYQVFGAISFPVFFRYKAIGAIALSTFSKFKVIGHLKAWGYNIWKCTGTIQRTHNALYKVTGKLKALYFSIYKCVGVIRANAYFSILVMGKICFGATFRYKIKGSIMPTAHFLYKITGKLQANLVNCFYKVIGAIGVRFLVSSLAKRLNRVTTAGLTFFNDNVSEGERRIRK